MKITNVQARRHSGNTSDSYHAEIVIVEVSTDADITGFGFAMAAPKMGAIFQHLIETILAPQIIGGDPQLTGDLWQKRLCQIKIHFDDVAAFS